MSAVASNNVLFDFRQLVLHTQDFRRVADQLFTLDVTSCDAIRSHFLKLLLSTSQLYMDCIQFTVELPSLYANSFGGACKHIAESQLQRERDYRERYRRIVESLPWQHFRRHEMYTLLGLNSAEKYQTNLSLHIPEMYEESFRVETYAGRLSRSTPKSSLSELEVNFSHLADNHAVFALPALKGMSEDVCWSLEFSG